VGVVGKQRKAGEVDGHAIVEDVELEYSTKAKDIKESGFKDGGSGEELKVRSDDSGIVVSLEAVSDLKDNGVDVGVYSKDSATKHDSLLDDMDDNLLEKKSLRVRSMTKMALSGRTSKQENKVALNAESVLRKVSAKLDGMNPAMAKKPLLLTDNDEHIDDIIDGSIKREQQMLRKLQVVWFPKYEDRFEDGYCTNMGDLVHGVPTFPTQEKCCTAWFPYQPGNVCLTYTPPSASTRADPIPTPSPINPNPKPTPSPTNNPISTLGLPILTPSPIDPIPSTTNPIAPSTPPPIPNNCEDLPKYVDGAPLNVEWEMPNDSVWNNSPFSGLTCVELEDMTPEGNPAERSKLCEFLSQGIFSGPCAIEACCFCGGGTHNFAPRCENMEWNSMVDTGSGFNCEVIDTLPPANQDNFCDKAGEASFASDGLTMNEACCACGGGHRHYNHEFANGRRLQGGRKLQENGASAAGAAAAIVLPDGQSFVDFTYRVGAGDSPGIPNLEYLGLGYDLIRGNPRGSESSELDPGFRYRVLQLRQVQSDLTIDTEFTVPLGTAIKYTSSCKYDDSSVEVSSDSDMRTSLSKEAKTETSIRSSTSRSVSSLLYSFSSSVSASASFSQSEKFMSTGEKIEFSFI